jgi:hypothetical protein
MSYFRKKNRVAPAVILQGMGQLEADRRRAECRPPVKNAWAPSLADAVTGLQDVHMECPDDPHHVWRLETLLENARATVSEKQRCNEMLHDSLTKNGATIGKQEREITSLQEENERLQEDNEFLRDGSAVAKENERLQEENARLRAESAKSTKLVEGLEDILCCPISLQLLSDPVVSKVSGQSYEREYIEKCLKKKSTCPLTGLAMTHKHLVKNYTLADVANAFRAYQAAQEKAA